MTTLHLVRGDSPDGGPPLEALADHDWIVYLHPIPRLATPAPAHPIPAPITHADLVELVFAADRVITW